MGYARSPFTVFKSYLRNVVGLNEINIQLLMKQYFLIFIGYARPPGI